MTTRQLGYSLLDNNLAQLKQSIVKSLDSRFPKGWQPLIITELNRRKALYTSAEEFNLDYGNLPIVFDKFRASFDFIALRKFSTSKIYDHFCAVRDGRNLIAHHSSFTDEQLKKLRSDLITIFQALGISNSFAESGTFTSTADPVIVAKSSHGIKDNQAGLQNTDSIVPDVVRNTFIISQAKYGLGQSIIVAFNRGKHSGKRFRYSHDQVYDACIDKLIKLDSWHSDGFNVSSTSIRKEALPYVNEVI
jgi:hypothetical protein